MAAVDKQWSLTGLSKAEWLWKFKYLYKKLQHNILCVTFAKIKQQPGGTVHRCLMKQPDGCIIMEEKNKNKIMSYLFTSESVSEGHPDKVSDQISVALLDQFLAYDDKAHCAIETFCTTGQVVIMGEVRSSE